MSAQPVTEFVPLHALPLGDRVAAVVRAEMARYCLTPQRVADVLGITRQAVGQKRSGKATFTYEDLDRIGPLLGMSASQIVRAAEALGEGPGVPEGQPGGCAIRDSNPEPAG